MTIIHPFDDFLFELFPKANKNGKDINILQQEIEAYYTSGNIKPTVTIDDQLVTIQINNDLIEKQDNDFKKVIALCEKSKYAEAKPILKALIKANHTKSEYHRVLGQILSDEGEHDEAINSLIDALKWDPTNEFALIMMGNIFFRGLKDIETALKYFNQVVARNPNNALAFNNIASALLQQGKVEESLHFLDKAYEVDKTNPNTTYGLALAYEMKGIPYQAFEWATVCLKQTTGKNAQMYALSLEIVSKAITKIVSENDGRVIFEGYKTYLEKMGGVEIREIQDSEIPTTGKLEIAENYNRDYHLIKYKKGSDTLVHLKMHELVHLELIYDARKAGINKLFIASGEQKMNFLTQYKDSIKKLKADGIPENAKNKYMTGLFEGINLQIFNTPIDLFIEDYLYQNYKDLRPYQFAYIYSMLISGKESVLDQEARKYAPVEIYKATKILNLVNAIHFRDIFGLDMVKEFQPTPLELKEANQFWEEFKEYREDKEPAEEYELVENWGKDLKLDSYFEFVFENDFRNRPQNLDEFMESIESDPLGTDVDTQYKEEQSNKFAKSQATNGTNMVVVIFMVEALEYFATLSREKVKKIALDIAMLGSQGFNTEKDGYRVPSIPDRTFSGYQILAYYYVSWSLALPEYLKELNLPYDEEYKIARGMYKGDR